MRVPRLGVNIDHVATIRQARGTQYPSLLNAAEQSISAGADQITIHLRADRRHIQDADVLPLIKLCHQKKSLLNLEISCDPLIVNLACHYQPDWVCIVPERLEEQTTEGGLNIKDQKIFKDTKQVIEKLKQLAPKTKISLFVAPDIEIIPLIKELNIEAVEIHTGDFAHQYPQMKSILQSIKNFITELKKTSIKIHAGHGLTNASIVPLLELKLIEEYNIGHWIIAESLFHGLHTVVKNLKNQIINYPIN